MIFPKDKAEIDAMTAVIQENLRTGKWGEPTGSLLGFSIPSVKHSDAVSDILEHHGVKGMRWGVRRKNIGSANEKVVSEDAKKAAGASSKAKIHGKQALSNEEMQSLVTRMNLERQLSQLTPPSRAQKGARFVTNLLVNTGKQQAQAVVNDQINRQIKKALGGK